MSKDISIHIPGLLSKTGTTYHFKQDELIITEDALKYSKKVIKNGQVMSLRFGIKWIRGRYFVIGRHFTIELKLDNGNIIPIKFSSYYGIKRKLYTERYSNLVNAVWLHLIYPDIVGIIDRLNNGETIYISGVDINQDGLRWDDKELITWDKVVLKNYITYFVIKYADNIKLNKNLNFLNDWDAFILQRTLQYIVEQRAKLADQKFDINLN